MGPGEDESEGLIKVGAVEARRLEAAAVAATPGHGGAALRSELQVAAAETAAD
jgi:hypothetical protein